MKAATSRARRFWIEEKIAVESGSSAARSPRSMADDVAERPQQMLIDRVVMIHIELHHRHDTPELGKKAAEHAGFVHVAERGFRVILGGQAATERCCWLRDRAEIVVDKPQRSAKQPNGVRMQIGARAGGLREKADEIDRIASKNFGVGDVQAIVVDAEIGFLRELRAASSSSAG